MNKTFYQSFLPEGIFVIQERGGIVNEKERTEIQEKDLADVQKIEYVGENKKKILILINDSKSKTINDQDKEFLGKILGAIKLTYNDIALVNSSNYPSVSLNDLENSISFTKVILFGDGLNQVFENRMIAKYKITDIETFEILYSDSLTDIQEDKAKKIKLWEELKKMFT